MTQEICLVAGQSCPDGVGDPTGSSFLRLALILAAAGHRASILVWQTSSSDSVAEIWREATKQQANITVASCHIPDYVSGSIGHREISYAVAQNLMQCARQYDAVHFIDKGGAAYYTLQARKAGLYRDNVRIIVQLQAPTRWRLDVLGVLFQHVEHLRADFMERHCIENCDLLVSPNVHLLEWAYKNGITTPSGKRTKILRHLHDGAYDSNPAPRTASSQERSVRNIVFMDRLDERNGITTFFRAIQMVDPFLCRANVGIHLIGDFGLVDGLHSALYLSRAIEKLDTTVGIHLSNTRIGALSHLRKLDRPIIVAPSASEMTPYAVLDCVSLGLPILASDAGGIAELLPGSYRNSALIEMIPTSLARRLKEVVTTGCSVPALASSEHGVEEEWMEIYESASSKAVPAQVLMSESPKVVLGITTYERPNKVFDAVVSASRQTYKNIEVVVVDDGSQSEESVQQMPRLSALLKQLNGRLIRRDNGYLGAARNTIINQTKSDYVIFLDDDDIALEDMVANFVRAAERSRADIVTGPNIAISEEQRSGALLCDGSINYKPYYIPLGGPLSLGPIENCFSSATALIRRQVFRDIGVYSELKNVGFEDYEFYFRAAQNAKVFLICPVPSFFYEVGGEGMLNSTSFDANFRRVLDSLDIARNPGAWRDFVRLQSGSRAWNLEAAKIKRRRSDRHVGRFYECISDKQATATQLLLAVSEYCSELGLARAAEAWHSSFFACGPESRSLPHS